MKNSPKARFHEEVKNITTICGVKMSAVVTENGDTPILDIALGSPCCGGAVLTYGPEGQESVDLACSRCGDAYPSYYVIDREENLVKVLRDAKCPVPETCAAWTFWRLMND